MTSYYAQLLRQLPSALFSAGNAWLTLSSLVLAALAWAGLSEGDLPPWLAVVPVLVIAFYLLLRANYKTFSKAKEKADRTEQAEQLVELLREENIEWKQKYEVSQRQYEVFKQFDDEGH